MKAKSNYMPLSEFRTLIDEVPQIIESRILNSDEIQMLFKVTYHLGLRISETINLEAKDFDLEDLEVGLGKTKEAINDFASIPPEFKNELKTYLKNHSWREGKLWPIGRITVYLWLKKLGKILDINCLNAKQSETGEKTITHAFRKSKAKHMLFSKAPINIIQGKLRHKDSNTTMRYLRLNLADVKNWEAQK